MIGALDEGTRLGGRYVLESRLGSGGAATVWLAHDEVLERSVAVKVLSEALASDSSWLARFRREARLAASLSHPNLVSVYDFSAESDRPYLVMAHMPGGSLYERIQSGEHLDPEALAQDLLAALSAIHATGIIHRDLKPGNVLLAADGTACLTDFGVARPEDATSLTQTGHIPGTARFMAPELWKGHAADERSDLYAMGILLRQAVGDDASPELHELIDRLSAENPEDRPRSAAAALDELGAPEPTPTVPIATSPLPEETTPRTIAIESQKHPYRRAAIAGLAVLAVLAVVAFAQAIGGGDENPSSGQGNAGTASESGNSGSSGSGSGSSGSGSGGQEATTDETTTEPEEPVDAVALDREGLALIEAGDPEGAIPLLQRAVDSYPEGSRDINYAYSLYNLGNALYLAGRPEEAIPYLKERLTFDDQTETVQATLNAAEEAAGLEGGKPPKPPKGPKPKDD